MGVAVCGCGSVWVWQFVGVAVYGCGSLWVWQCIGASVCCVPVCRFGGCAMYREVAAFALLHALK